MHLPATILLTKIVPPRPGPRTLKRPRLDLALAEARTIRLTLVQAGAGYGKTTALASLAETGDPLIWYQVMEEDGEPLVFLLHLCHATRRALPELRDLPIPLLEAWDGTSTLLPAAQVLDRYLNSLSAGLSQPVLLVIDDAHLLAGDAQAANAPVLFLLDRLIGLAPPDLHILLAGRPPLSLPNLARWKGQGWVHLVDRQELAFTAAEIAALFSQQYGYDLTGEEAELLYNATEGWAVALQLVWQSLRSGAFASVEDALYDQAASLDSLFHVLAKEVFAGQPADVQDFLRISATLRRMTPEACNALRGAGDSAALLAYLRRLDLFVSDGGDGSLRYHHIFHNFLQQLTSLPVRREWHRQAAAFYLGQGDAEEAFYHLQHAGDLPAMADLLVSYGAQLLASGRLDTLGAYLGSLAPDVLQDRPALLCHLGDLARLRSRFQEALGWYHQAEIAWQQRGQSDGVSRALRGQARVYIDTVNPSQAEELLEKSLRLIDGIEGQEMRLRLYELLAENKLNLGQVEEAEQLRMQADVLRNEGPSDSQLLFRVLLRTGRLAEARQKLEARVEAERVEPVLTPRAHRETQLLLSLVYSFLGLPEAAYTSALEGTRRSIDLQSPFSISVGFIRQGHARLLQAGSDRFALAQKDYERASEIGQNLEVDRLRVEACWGLCRVHGLQGNLTQAQQVSQEGIEIASRAGDEWIASLVRTALGSSLALAGRYEQSVEWLTRAAQGFQECSDPFGRSAAHLWLTYVRFRQGNTELLAQLLPDTLAACREHGYDFLLTRPSLLGPLDERIFVPLLIQARERGWQPQYAIQLLGELGLPDIVRHPGYQLRVSTLGGFQTFRGSQAVHASSWRRAKARHLFQILLTYRHAPLDREQLLEYLWPEQTPAAAQRSFKVTLNTLYQVLEPERDSGDESAYIVREGSTYCLRPGADLWLDAEEFASSISHAEVIYGRDPLQAAGYLEAALQLYKGEYLPEARYDTWAAAERERLSVLFLRAADRLTELYLRAGRSEDVVELCYRILAADNCWERAYRSLMLAYAGLGDRGHVARTFQRCTQTLRQELDVDPSAETVSLYRRLVNEE